MYKSKYKKNKKTYPKRTHKQLSKDKKEEDLEIDKKMTYKSNKDIIKYNISKIYETINCINDNTFELKKLILTT